VTSDLHVSSGESDNWLAGAGGFLVGLAPLGHDNAPEHLINAEVADPTVPAGQFEICDLIFAYAD